MTVDTIIITDENQTNKTQPPVVDDGHFKRSKRRHSDVTFGILVIALLLMVGNIVDVTIRGNILIARTAVSSQQHESLSSSISNVTIRNDSGSDTALDSIEPKPIKLAIVPIDTNMSVDDSDGTTFDVSMESLSLGDVDRHQQQVVVHANHTHMFWNKSGQQKLCHLIQSMKQQTGNGAVGGVLQLRINCTQVSSSESYGQGNWVTAFYAVRLVTSYYNVNLDFQCLEAIVDEGGSVTDRSDNSRPRQSATTLQHLKQHLLLPWLTGFYPPSRHITSSSLTEDDVCTNRYEKIRIDQLIYEIQHDMRQMASQISLPSSTNGIVPSDHDEDINTHNNDDDDDNDDVVIHFRCGDILGGQLRNDFGMIPFRSYTNRIDPATTSRIGIVTQPFESYRNRRIDQVRIGHCRRVVESLVVYLQRYLKFSNSTAFVPTVRIHNGINETIPIAYSRIIRAKQQAFTTLSSFGIFPVIGTNGQGYYQRGNDGVNPWSKSINSHRFDDEGSDDESAIKFSNLHEMNEPVLGSKAIFYVLEKYGLDPILQWFMDDNDSNSTNKSNHTANRSYNQTMSMSSSSIPEIQEGIEAAANSPGKTLPKLKRPVVAKKRKRIG